MDYYDLLPAVGRIALAEEAMLPAADMDKLGPDQWGPRGCGTMVAGDHASMRRAAENRHHNKFFRGSRPVVKRLPIWC